MLASGCHGASLESVLTLPLVQHGGAAVGRVVAVLHGQAACPLQPGVVRARPRRYAAPRATPQRMAQISGAREAETQQGGGGAGQPQAPLTVIHQGYTTTGLHATRGCCLGWANWVWFEVKGLRLVRYLDFILYCQIRRQ